MRVVAVDPGGTTGLCLLDGREVVASHEVSTLPGLWAWLRGHPADVMVVERFTGGGGREAAAPLMACGVAELAAADTRAALVYQTPQAQNRYRAEVAGAHHGVGRHARSAIAHALYYLDRHAESVAAPL